MTPESGARELFIWYRVRDTNSTRVRTNIESMQRSLVCASPMLEARLLIRIEDAGLQTWMETYRFRDTAPTHPQGIDDAFQASIEAAAAPIREWIESERHVEAFTPASAA